MGKTSIILLLLTSSFASLIFLVVLDQRNPDLFLFQPPCFDDGVLYGRRNLSGPLDPYYLREARELADYAGLRTVQFGPLLWVSSSPVRPTPPDFWSAGTSGYDSAWEKWHRNATFLSNVYWRAAVGKGSTTSTRHREIHEDNPILVRRIGLFARWLETDPPGYWSNENHFPGICFAELAYLRPTWAQMPWELMPRLIWQDQLQRIGAALNGLPAR